MGIRFATTDASGRFRLPVFAFGSYYLFASDEDADYPNTRFSLFGGDTPTVRVAPRAPDPQVLIHVYKAAVVAGRVTGIAPGRATTLVAKLTRQDGAKWVSETISPSFRILVPPSVPVRIAIYAVGGPSAERTVRLPPGWVAHWNVRLPTAPKRPGRRPSASAP